MPEACIDLRPFACPITWVKTKVALERLTVGQVLEIWLCGGEPLDSVPRSAEEDGHRLLVVEPLKGPEAAWRVLLEKGEPPPALP
jgi:TusA-related sulfurtransferase